MQALHLSRRLVVAVGIGLLAGCAAKPVPLYLWESFPQQQYDVLQHSGASADQQLQAMEAHMTKARATNAALPPGFLAHLGMLQLSLGHAQRAKEMFESEKAAFPESAPYMDKLLGKLGDTAQSPLPTKTDKPA